MSWWSLIPGAVNLATTYMNKPKKKDYMPDTSSVDRYISNLRGQAASREVYNQAMQPALRQIGSQRRESQRQLDYSAAQTGLEGSGIEAQKQLSLGEQTLGAVERAGDTALAAQLQESRRLGLEAERATMQKEQAVAAGEQAFSQAKDQRKQQLRSQLLGLAGAAATQGLQTMSQNKKVLDTLKLSGVVGEGTTMKDIRKGAKSLGVGKEAYIDQLGKEAETINKYQQLYGADWKEKVKYDENLSAGVQATLSQNPEYQEYLQTQKEGYIGDQPTTSKIDLSTKNALINEDQALSALNLSGEADIASIQKEYNENKEALSIEESDAILNYLEQRKQQEPVFNVGLQKLYSDVDIAEKGLSAIGQEKVDLESQNQEAINLIQSQIDELKGQDYQSDVVKEQLNIDALYRKRDQMYKKQYTGAFLPKDFEDIKSKLKEGEERKRAALEIAKKKEVDREKQLKQFEKNMAKATKLGQKKTKTLLKKEEKQQQLIESKKQALTTAQTDIKTEGEAERLRIESLYKAKREDLKKTSFTEMREAQESIDDYEAKQKTYEGDLSEYEARVAEKKRLEAKFGKDSDLYKQAEFQTKGKMLDPDIVDYEIEQDKAVKNAAMGARMQSYINLRNNPEGYDQLIANPPPLNASKDEMKEYRSALDKSFKLKTDKEAEGLKLNKEATKKYKGNREKGFKASSQISGLSTIFGVTSDKLTDMLNEYGENDGAYTEDQINTIRNEAIALFENADVPDKMSGIKELLGSSPETAAIIQGLSATPKGRRQAVQKLINNIVSKLPVSFSPQTDGKKSGKVGDINYTIEVIE